MSKEAFKFPLKFHVLEAFCHPVDWHVFARPAHQDGQALAGNGFALIRAHRGLWMPADFLPASPDFLKRFHGAPWREIPVDADWRALDAVTPKLFRFGAITCWTREGKCAPSPVWRVGRAFLGRVSHLQLIAKLPRCEVLLPEGRTLDAEPLHFRFSGGAGMLAHDPRLSISSAGIFQPQYCPLDGQEMKRTKPLNWNFGTPPPPEPPIEDWPPVPID